MKIEMSTVEKVLSEVIFYDDALNRNIVYAKYTMQSGEPRLSSIDEEDFKAFLRIAYADESGCEEQLNEVPIIQRIHDESRTRGKNEKIVLSHRVAGDQYGVIEYFLSDSEETVVQVDANGVRIADETKYKFVKRDGTHEQVRPLKNDEDLLDLLQPFVNIKGEAYILFVIWLIQAFSSGSHFCIFLSAERGSGKSLLTHVINKLIDPSSGETCSMPRNRDDLETLLNGQYLVCLDNIDRITKDFSDTFCIAVTGGQVARRKKFYDTNVVYLQLHNVLVFNGIGIGPEEADLAERSLFFPMRKLDSTELVPERELWQMFEIRRAKILWHIFETLSKAMQLIHTVKPTAKERMADAYVEMLAIAKVLGVSEERFNAMLKNSTASMGKIYENDPVTKAIMEHMEQRGSRKLHGSSTDVYNLIKSTYSGEKGPLPMSAAAFGKQLNQLDVPLKKLGYRFLIDDTGAKGNTITIIKSK